VWWIYKIFIVKFPLKHQSPLSHSDKRLLGVISNKLKIKNICKKSKRENFSNKKN